MSVASLMVLCSSASRRTCLSVIALAVVAMLAPGCETQTVTTSDGWRMPPPPREAPTPPPALRADRMAFTVGSKPQDTNNNGFPDSIHVSVSLFSSQHPTSLRQDGTFVFSMYRAGEFGTDQAMRLFEWRKSREQMKQAEASMLSGPCYLFQLNLLDFGTDRLPLEQTDLVCRFEPADKTPSVHCNGVRTIQIGRRMSADAR